MNPRFELLFDCPDTDARLGKLITAHGEIQTPVFMPVGTQATVKAVNQLDLQTLGAEIILGNTFHLYLRPGYEIISASGGLQQFTGWGKPMLTDSGGYQVYSLSSMRKITPDGVKFKSPIDGSFHFFSPEKAIDVQLELGADVIMAFDECTPYPCTYEYAKSSLATTHTWLERCQKYFADTEPKHGYNQILAPIVQGSTYTDLRIESAKFIADRPAEVNAIGGLSVGEPHELMYEMTSEVCRFLPHNRARYLMGVGTPVNLLESIARGIDMFDCVLPTRNARHGLLYTSEGVMNIKNAKWKNAYEPICSDSTSVLSQHHSRAYLRHLFHVNEYVGLQIASIHNLSFFLWLINEARRKIAAGSFNSWKKDICEKLVRRL